MGGMVRRMAERSSDVERRKYKAIYYSSLIASKRPCGRVQRGEYLYRGLE